MRTLLISAVLALFSTYSFALDQNAVNAEIASIKQKAASGQDVKGDIAALTNKLKADAKSLVVSNQVNLSVIDKSGTVSLFVPFPTTTHVIANSDEHIADAKAAIVKHPEASKAHNMDNLDGAVSLGGGSKKKSAAADPAAAAPASGSDGSIGGLISAGLGAVVSIGSSIVGGLLGSI